MTRGTARTTENAVATPAPELSIVVLSWNTRELTLACLRALERDASARAREVILVDNASGDGSAGAVAGAFPSVRLIHNGENRLYAAGNNQGAEAARGTYLCLLNSDTEVRPGALDQLVDFLAVHPEYAAASPKLVNADGTVQRACTRIPGLLDPLVDSTLFGRIPPGSSIAARTRMRDFDHLASRDVEQPPGACFVIRRDEYARFGGLDPALSLFYNDVDLCRRLARAGRRIRYVAEAQVLHHGGASTSRHLGHNAIWFQNRSAYYAKHYGLLGALWLALIRELWGAEVALGIALGPRDLAAKRSAWRDLGKHLRACRGSS